jgi:hypothetical protein
MAMAMVIIIRVLFIRLVIKFVMFTKFIRLIRLTRPIIAVRQFMPTNLFVIIVIITATIIIYGSH